MIKAFIFARSRDLKLAEVAAHALAQHDIHVEKCGWEPTVEVQLRAMLTNADGAEWVLRCDDSTILLDDSWLRAAMQHFDAVGFKGSARNDCFVAIKVSILPHLIELSQKVAHLDVSELLAVSGCKLQRFPHTAPRGVLGVWADGVDELQLAESYRVVTGLPLGPMQRISNDRWVQEAPQEQDQETQLPDPYAGKPVPIIFPLHPRGGKKRDNTELRYTLRSLEKYFQGEYEILIAGEKLPDWLQGATLLPCGGLKSALVAAANARPEGFFWWYDDCALLKKETATELKVTGACKGWMNAKTGWAKMLDQVKTRLEADGIHARDYSRPHGPYWFDKSMVDEGFADWPGMASKFPWESWILSKRRWSWRDGVAKQYYGPFRAEPSAGHSLLNYNDAGFTPELLVYLDRTFPEPSAFEIPEPPSDAGSKRAVSFCLYGDNPKYAVGMLENLRLCKEIYPGWDVVVHLEEGHYAKSRLAEMGARVIEHVADAGHVGMHWRFLTAALPQYEVVIFRDADSRVNVREKAAVDEWLKEGTALHVMRDHAHHGKPVMGGMWGLRHGSADIAGAVKDWAWTGAYGNDETFLASCVWPLLKNNATIHTSKKRSTGEKSFPPHDAYEGFVGECINVESARFCDVISRANTRVVLFSVEKYAKRRARFIESFNRHAGFLSRIGFEWWKATPHELTLAPPSFKDCRKIKHWWAATCDHLKIMEETLLAKTEHLFLFEDDCDFQPNFEVEFWKAWCSLPKGWKAMRLGFHRKKGSTPVTSALERCSTEGAWMGANFWNSAGLWRAYDHFWHRRKMIIDIMFMDLRKKEPHDWYQPTVDVIKKDKLATQQGRDN